MDQSSQSQTTLKQISFAAAGFILLNGAAAAMGHIPLNFILGAIGALLWFFVAILRSDWILAATNITLSLAAAVAYLNYVDII